MATIKDLNVKTLVKVLTELRGGTIGFDPYRDARTNNKQKLLAFILQSYDNNSIISAVTKVTYDSAAKSEHAQIATVRLHFKDVNNIAGVREFARASMREAQAAAVAWLSVNPTMRSVMPGMECLKSDGTWGPIAPISDSDASSETSESNDAQTVTAYSWSDELYGISDAAAMTATKDRKVHASSTDTAAPEADQIAKLLSSMAQKGAVDAEKVREICDARAQDYVDNILEAVNKRLGSYDDKIAKLLVPTVIEVKLPETQETKNLGVQHRNFEKLLKSCNARDKDGNRLNVWLYGPAGTGKTHSAHAIATALNLPFQSNGTLLTEHSLSGFIDASGRYHRTAFREIFENGGIYLGDEYDGWCPKASLWLQAALANGWCRFPDGMIKRHPDCAIIVGANTIGKGATSEFSARNKVDDANGDRFVYLDWPLDEALELAISPNPKWTARCQVVRKRVADRKLKGHAISPRRAIHGAALLAAGLDWETVEAMTLRRGLSDEQWGQIQ